MSHATLQQEHYQLAGNNQAKVEKMRNKDLPSYTTKKNRLKEWFDCFSKSPYIIHCVIAVFFMVLIFNLGKDFYDATAEYLVGASDTSRIDSVSTILAYLFVLLTTATGHLWYYTTSAYSNYKTHGVNATTSFNYVKSRWIPRSIAIIATIVVFCFAYIMTQTRVAVSEAGANIAMEESVDIENDVYYDLGDYEYGSPSLGASESSSTVQENLDEINSRYSTFSIALYMICVAGEFIFGVYFWTVVFVMLSAFWLRYVVYARLVTRYNAIRSVDLLLNNIYYEENNRHFDPSDRESYHLFDYSTQQCLLRSCRSTTDMRHYLKHIGIDDNNGGNDDIKLLPENYGRSRFTSSLIP